MDFRNLDGSPVRPSVAALGSVLLVLVPALVAGGGGMEGSEGGVKVQENKGEYSPVFVYILPVCLFFSFSGGGTHIGYRPDSRSSGLS